MIGTRFPAFLLALLPILAMLSCQSDPFDVDISDVKLKMETVHIDRELTSKNSAKLQQVNQELTAAGGVVYPYYLGAIMNIGLPGDSNIVSQLEHFVNDSTMDQLNREISKAFYPFGNKTSEIVRMFKYLKYHLPEVTVPDTIFTYNSGFSQGVISYIDPSSGTNAVGIGLDMYLGPDNPMVQRLSGEFYPQYQKDGMRARFLYTDVAKSWVQSELLEIADDAQFLDHMIYHGKALYIMYAMMPHKSEHIRMRWTKEQWNWAEEREASIWKTIVDQELVYSTKRIGILNFFNDAPFTSPDPDSPPRLGQYIGLKVVRAYMEANPELTIQDLLQMENNQAILNAYKPAS